MGKVMLGQWLDFLVLVGFSSQNNSMIFWFCIIGELCSYILHSFR